MAAIWEPESRKQRPLQAPTYEISGRLNSERENSLEEDPWYNWHKPEKAAWTEFVAAVVQWQGKQNPSLCSLGSMVAAEPHHAYLILLFPQR